MFPDLTADIPRDIPLPLPADATLLQFLIVVLFVLHIVFVNLMLGSTLLALRYEWRWLRKHDPADDELAHAIIETTTVTKSLAVVFGVAPLLLINVLYTVYFYTANALTGDFWISIIGLAATAFLLLYLHKYSWNWGAMRKYPLLHFSVGVLAAAILLFIPLIFLTNINLMLFPDQWPKVHGFWSAFWLPNVLPRYFHFLLASLAGSGLFLNWYFRSSWAPQLELWRARRYELTRTCYRITYLASLLQFSAGPLVLLTLPVRGLSIALFLSLTVGVLLAVNALVLLDWELRVPPAACGQRFWRIVMLLGGTVLFMAFGRHLYREEALSQHRHQVAAATSSFQAASDFAAAHHQDTKKRLPADEKAFVVRCSVCHAVDKTLAGPPLTEIATLYAGKPAEIVAWAKAPGRKRQQFKGMPSMAHVPDSELRLIAEYILRVGQPAPVSPPTTSAATPTSTALPGAEATSGATPSVVNPTP